MKIRMNHNTLRLRLSQTETEQFAREGTVTTITRFGVGSFLSYSLVRAEKAEGVFTSFEKNEIKIMVPKKLAEQWTSTDMTGFQENIPLNAGNSLFVLVEKDFECLHKRPAEDDSDSFPNPMGKPANLDA